MSEAVVLPSAAVRRARVALDVALYAHAISLAAGIAPIQISLAFIGLGAVVLHLFHAGHGPGLRPTALARPLALFLATVVLVALARADAGASPMADDVRGVLRLGAAILIGASVRDGRQAFRLGAVFVLACAVQGSYGVLQHFTGWDLLRPAGKAIRRFAPGTRERWLVFGTYPRHATFAFVGHVALIFVASAFVTGALKRRWAIIAAVASIPIGFGALFTTLRMIWAGFGAALVAMGAIEARWRRIGVALAAMALALGLATAVSPALQAKLSNAFNSNYSNNSHRGFMWARSFAMLVDEPGGIGAGTFKARTKEYYSPWYPKFSVRCHSHNNFLFAWVESGPLALVALIWFFAATLAVLRRGIKEVAATADQEESRERRAVLLGAAGTVVSTLVWSITHDPLYDGVIVYTLGFAIGLGIAAAGPAAEAREDERLSPAPPGHGPAWIPALAGSGVATTALLGAASPAAVSGAEARAAVAALVAIALSFVPRLPAPVVGVLRLVGVLGGLALVGPRSFLPIVGSPTEALVRGPGSLVVFVALAALLSAVATAAWAMRRPGEVGAGPVAGALAFAFAAGWPFALVAGGYALLSTRPETWPASYDFTVWGCAASLLAAAFVGPLRGGAGRGTLAAIAPAGTALALALVALRAVA